MLHRLLVPLALISSATLCGSPPPPAAAPFTAEEIFRRHAIGQASLSPNGRQFGAIVTDEKDQRHLLIVDLKDYKQSGLRGHDKLDIASFDWLGDDGVLYDVTRNKRWASGLYTAILGSLDSRTTVNDEDATVIVGVPRARPGNVIVWIAQSREGRGESGGVVEYDTARNKIVRTYAEPAGADAVAWIPNRQGELAICMTWTERRRLFHRYVPERNSWRELKIDPEVVRPLGLDPDDRYLWVVTQSDKAGYELRRCDLNTENLGEPVFADAAYDLADGHLHFSDRTGELTGITYEKRKVTTVWFSEDYAAIQAFVDKNCPGGFNVLIDRDHAERKLLFRATGPQQPGTYVLLDLDAKSLHPLAQVAPWLKGRQFQPTQPITFRTRDRQQLEGYLTLPAGASEQHPVPLVVLAHGGPWVRDTPDFAPEVQFLASRGYAVLQPNYRGSSGYAPAISFDRKYDFRRMHDDVTDATRAMLRSPLIDSKRVAIMGASFGGFLSVAGVAFEDGLYRCAITQCGVFDWARLIKDKRMSRNVVAYETLLDKLGRPGRDQPQFEQISPLARADQISVPVLIAHGVKDGVVEVEQSRKLAAALKKRGIPHETFFRALEGHGFYNYKNRVDYYHRVEAFLAANLGGASLTEGN